MKISNIIYQSENIMAWQLMKIVCILWKIDTSLFISYSNKPAQKEVFIVLGKAIKQLELKLCKYTASMYL